MNIIVDTNVDSVRQDLQLLFHDQLPWATSRALNRVAVEARDEIRAGIHERFTVRRQWVPRGIQIPRGGHATKQRMHVEIEVERQRDFLVKFEEGGTIWSTNPNDPKIFIPTDVIRRSKEDLPPRKLYPKNLGLARRRAISGGFIEPKVHTTRRGIPQFKGRYRTFRLDPQHHRGVTRRMIYQRLDWETIVPLWHLPDSIRIEPLLQFEATARRVVEARWEPIFAEEFFRAATTARRVRS